MRHALLVAFAAPLLAFQDPTLSDKHIQVVKDATVLIRVTDGTDIKIAGIGIAVRVDGEFGYVLARWGTTDEKIQFEVVFDSGLPKERRSATTVVGRDGDAWTILKLPKAGFPQPLPISASTKFVETQKLFGCGPVRPVERGRIGPVMSITAGTLTKIIVNKSGAPSVLQTADAINPENLGGPVVNAAGELVGVAAAMKPDTGIGAALTASFVNQLFDGIIATAEVSTGEAKAGNAKLSFKTRGCDPLSRIKSAAILMVYEDKVPARTEHDPLKPIVVGMTEVPLARSKEDWTGEGTFIGDAKTDVNYTIQVKWIAGDGRTLYSEPFRYLAEFTRGDNKSNAAPGWIGSDATAGSMPPIEVKKGQPVPVVIDELLLGEETVFDGYVTRPLMLSKDTLVRQAAWSLDGKFLYLLDKPGLVRKIAVPEFKEERRLKIAQACDSMGMSKEGLAVLVTGSDEIWVLDESTLEVRRRITTGAVSSLAVSPGTSTAFVNAGDRELLMLNLGSGAPALRISSQGWHQKMVKTKQAPQSPGLQSWGPGMISPDGRQFYTTSTNAIHRFKIQDKDLSYTDIGPRITGDSGLSISPDGIWLGMKRCSPEGVKDLPELPKGGSWLFKTMDLLKPASTLPGQFLCFLSGGRVLVVLPDRKLAICTTDGKQERVMDGFQAPEFTAGHASGGFLCATQTSLSWVMPK